jgi:hypothetical protein
VLTHQPAVGAETSTKLRNNKRPHEHWNNKITTNEKMEKRNLRTMLFGIFLFFGHFFTVAGVTPPEPGTDYTLHTLYIFNFTRYVEWPAGAKSIKIGVVDNESAEEYLNKMAKAKSGGGAEISVINTKNDSELGSCQIIFIPSGSTAVAAKLIESFSARPILIVTEDADLTKKGASVSFKVVANKLRFQINEEVVKNKGLKVSSSLLSLAER